MEVFDKEGVAVRKNRSEGFVMAEVLVTVLFVTVFTSLLFSSGARRYRSALNFAAGTEARLAAEAVAKPRPPPVTIAFFPAKLKAFNIDIRYAS